MSNLAPSGFPPERRLRPVDRTGRNLERSLTELERATFMRQAAVHADGAVQAQKLREVDHLTEVALSGHALLSRWRDVLAGSDPLLHDDLNFILGVSKLAKADLLMDSIDTMRRR